MADPKFYRSTTGAMELEFIAGDDEVSLCFFPREDHAMEWNGLALNKDAVRSLIDDLSGWLSDAAD